MCVSWPSKDEVGMSKNHAHLNFGFLFGLINGLIDDPVDEPEEEPDVQVCMIFTHTYFVF